MCPVIKHSILEWNAWCGVQETEIWRGLRYKGHDRPSAIHIQHFEHQTVWQAYLMLDAGFVTLQDGDYMCIYTVWGEHELCVNFEDRILQII
jgi:hypothetical protein